ncbi:sensor histidine kinase [Cellulomonas bogoriensis]|uniref:histidine kinase n=1 Tax=Cellulomonas bogoriensis 69B4 = DSM 16987 TaxID=1386082 RepID=A0A0A0C3X1_9CELL|nr:HAMP domain-containing sensor histidine kinase [Cellulomonas bogoriensis]KGM14079.1 histidine kinase [Cellulomonas bogoriensis 69B4 = DSM 16987]
MPSSADAVSWVARQPLRTRLTAVFAALLLLGLTVTGFTALTLLRQSLVDQLDTQLSEVTPALLRQAQLGNLGYDVGDQGLPTVYALRLSAASGDPVRSWAVSSATVSEPDLPVLTAGRAHELDGDPFTVDDAVTSGRWRVLVRPLVDWDGTTIGSVAVALPMTAADATADQMRRALLAITVAVVTVGAGAGWWGVRRALRPLRQIEATAAHIAAGDLARRVPDSPTSTEVGHLAAALNSMLAQIEQAFADRTASEQRMRRFVADASHELRTPLATIRGYSELYRMGAIADGPEVGDTLRRIEDSATRMGSLVDDLLQLARLDEGRGLRRSEVDLAVLAADAAADLRALDPTRQVRVTPLGGSTAGALVDGDEDRLRQVLANLVGNVARHTPAGTPAEIAVGRPDPHGPVVLEVVDHGPGIDPGHASRVFERFYRVDAARGRDTGGSGLGMAIVAAVVAAHHGVVHLARTEDGGTTVRVELPAR